MAHSDCLQRRDERLAPYGQRHPYIWTLTGNSNTYGASSLLFDVTVHFSSKSITNNISLVSAFPVIKDVLLTLAVSGPVHKDYFPLPAVRWGVSEYILAGQGNGVKSWLCWLHSESDHQQQGHRYQTLASGESSEWS